MSRLAVGKDDHPEAARKHFADASVLQVARRYDSAAYHSGYVVECSLKTVLLHDRSYDSATGSTDAAKLSAFAKTLSGKTFGHKLLALLTASIGAEGARYLPAIVPSASVLTKWTETMRYWPAGQIKSSESAAFISWAEMAVGSIIQMTLDGVL